MRAVACLLSMQATAMLNDSSEGRTITGLPEWQFVQDTSEVESDIQFRKKEPSGPRCRSRTASASPVCRNNQNKGVNPDAAVAIINCSNITLDQNTLHNLADNPEYAKVKGEMAAALEALLKESPRKHHLN